MEFLQLSISGLDDFLVYFGLALVFVALYLAIYVRITPYGEFALIRAGNAAAAASLSGSLLGFCLPLASAMVHSVNLWDMGLWAAIALTVQLLVYLAVRALLPQLGRDIPQGKVAPGVFLGAASLAAGLLNAAAMSW